MRIALRFLFAIGFFLGSTVVSNAQAPVADFSATPLTSCSPLIVQFTDLSTNTPTSWSWNLGNGTTSTLQNPSTTYTTAGTYTVTLVASNASGSHTRVYTNYITVTPAPFVNFIANDSTSGCGTKTVTVTNLSNPNTTGTAIYYWDFGDGYTSSAQNPPAHTYTSPGTYTISLVVTNSTGCVQSLSKPGYITVLSKPIAAFTASNASSCSAPLTTSFSNTSTGAASYDWDFGDGTTSTASAPTHIYSTAGSFTVRLITTGASGCKDTLTKTGFVNIGTITAGFIPSVLTTCTKNPVTFTNTSVPGGGGSTWYFGDGTTSTQVSPVHAYTVAGTYTVKLVVAYSTCSDSTTRTIVVSTGPATSFSGSPQAGCKAPLTVSFSNTTSGAASYLWLFGDGSTSTAASPAHTYTTLGTYTVKLISTSSNGCTDTMTKTNFVVIDTPTATLNTYPFLGCAPAPASFTALINSVVPVAAYSWNFGDGTTTSGTFAANHTYTTAGTYTVTLTMTTTTGCLFTASQTVFVGAHTTPAFSASPTTVCLRSGVTFTNTSSGGATNYQWLFGDGGSSTLVNPVYTYGAPGIFSVTLISSNYGCADTIVRSNYITVNPPRANFTHIYSCANRTQFTFTNTSVGATSYSWDFGDGNTSTTASPTHTYAAMGTYTVTLIATSSVTGCVDTMVKAVKAFPLNAGFSTLDTAICIGSRAAMTPNDPDLTSYMWEFGTIYYLSGGYPTPGFTNAGYYSVKLVVRDAQNCTDSLTRANYINVHAPTASFTQSAGSGCSQLLVTFTDNSTASSGRALTSRVWDFGDGNSLTTTATTVSHVYMAAGTFSVKLTVTETGGCTHEVIHANVIHVSRPVANFYSPDVLTCKGRPTSFVNTSTGSGTMSYSWSFGDGSTSLAGSPTYTYAAVGNYSVRLIVTDAGGCKDTLLRPAYIDVSDVKSAFTMSDSAGPCPPFTVSFTNASVGAASYLWMFGNGGSSTLTNPSAAFLTAGTFTVKLIATNASGCKDTSTRTIVIGTGPTGTFSYSPLNGCSPLNITFSGSSAGSSSLTYDFGNGVTTTTTTTTGSVNYTYVLPGRFRPTLILSDINGCSKFIVGPDTISVNKANAGFSYSTGSAASCVGVAVQFTDASTAALSGISTRNWDFGDGSTSTAANPSHIYAAAGTYNVRLIAGTPNGCMDTLIQTVTINPLPIVTAANQTICGNGSAQLTATGAASYTWSPATGLSCTSCVNPVATPTITTTYAITGTSAAGCVGTGTVTVNVNTSPVVSAGAAQSICSGASATLTATGAATYSWSPSTGLSATTGASVTASPAGTTVYTVIGTTVAGCSDTDQVTVTVNPIPTLSVTPSQTICAGSSTTLTATGATTYSWSPATGLSSSTSASVTASPSATTTYTVTGTANGCNATATTTVNVTPIPVLSITGNNAICAGASTALTATGATIYSWSPATALSCTTCANPTASPTTTITYTVTGTTSGCSDTATKIVTVNQLPVVQASADVAICAGAATTLSASGASSYVWSPGSGLSSTTVASPLATPSSTTNYIVSGTDANGCTNNDSVTVTVNPLPIVSAGSNTSICPGGSANLSATGATSYSWTPSTGLSCTACSNPVATPSATTTYKVTGTSAAGCFDSASVTVAVNSVPVISVTGTNAICIGGSTVLTAAGANAFSWSPATGLSATTGGSVTANPTTTTTYTITGTSGVGCTGTTTYTVTVNPLPTINAGADVVICSGASTSLSASGAATYSWSPATGLSATTGATVTANPATTTSYIVTGTSSTSCVNTDTVIVTVNPLPVVSGGSNTSICPGGSATLTATGAASYSWTPSTGLSCTTCANPIASPAATTTYTVAGTTALGCTDSAHVTVTVNGVPVITVSGTLAICSGGSTSLTASGANSFSWSPATGLSATTGGTVTANPSSTTTYTVTGTSGIGCAGTTTVTVTVNALPIVLASADTAICAGASATLGASGAISYVWSPASGLSSTTIASPTATPSATTNFIVSGTDANGCTNKDSVTVTVNPLPVVSAGSNTSICPGGSANLTATGATTYSWTPAGSLSCVSCANPVASPSSTTTYTVTGTSAAGCSATSSVTVAVNSVPVVSVTGTNAICIGGSTVLTATGANAFSWSPATGLSATTGASVTANPATTTTYTITGASGVGCTGTTTFTVTVNPLPTVFAGIDTVVCTGSSVALNATGAANYVWSPATGLSCTSCASPVASPAATTTYIVTGTATTGCVNKDTIIVSVNALPTVSAGNNTSVCPGGSSTLNATGAVSYSWTPAATLSCAACASPVATPTATTKYTVTGTGSNGCTDTSSVTVAVNGVPVVTVAGSNAICAGGSTFLIASGANAFSWSPATGLSATTGATVAANPATTTTYTITGTSGVGCTGSTTFTVTVNPLPTVSAGPDVAICSGASTTLSAIGAATYAWSPGAGLSSVSGASVTASPASTTSYIVTGSSSAGCVNADTVIVTVNPLPTVSAGSNTSICPGGSTPLTATGGATYSWTPSTGLSCTTCANPVASPASTTVYVVTGTSTDGCSSTASVTVSVNQVPVITVSGPTTICAGVSTTLTAAGANSFAWSPATGLSSATGATVTASPAATTTYTITGTSGVGCTGTTTVTITVNPLPVVSAGPNVAICSGASTTLTATGANSYAWSPSVGLSTPASASTIATPAFTTTYTVTGTSAAGCPNSANVTVTVNPLPAVSAGNSTSICTGGSTTLTATGALSYVWSPAASLSCATCASPIATPSATTTYTVVGTSGDGCTNTSSVTVSVNQLPVVNVTGNTTICLGNTTRLTATGASNYSWSPATGLSCTTCPSPVASPTTTTTYTVTGTSGVGCVSVATITVTVNPLPVITVTDSDTACLNTPVQLLAGGATTYFWTPATGLSCTGCSNPIATPSATTTYTVVGTDLNGCSSTAQTTLTILSLPPVDAGPDVSSCKLNSVVLNASGAVSYVWSPATGLSCTTCVSPTATPTASTTYVLTGTGANGCIGVDTVNVILYAQPPVNAGPNQTICAGSSAQLQASGASNYVWTPATDLSCVACANPLSTPDSTITYMVSGTDLNGCHDSDLVTISVIQRGPVSIDSGGAFCVGESLQLQASGGNGYTWTPGAGLNCTDCPNPVASPVTTTTYTVVIRQGQCFSDTLSTTVVVHPLPTVNAGPDQSIILGSFAQIKVSGTDISRYSWTPYDGLSCTDCATPATSPAVNTTYVVTVTSEAGCTATDDIRINVRCDGAQVWMPNTFTPNADGQNDFFYPHGKGLSRITRFRIYDRWGELIFDRMNMPVNDRDNGWDGTYKNQTLKPDVYVWILNAVCTNGEPLELKGDISLIR